jgi:hypothetical protein
VFGSKEASGPALRAAVRMIVLRDSSESPVLPGGPVKPHGPLVRLGLHVSLRVYLPPIYAVVSCGPSVPSRGREDSSWEGLPT